MNRTIPKIGAAVVTIRTIALLGWCADFLPIGVLAYKHFQKAQ